MDLIELPTKWSVRPKKALSANGEVVGQLNRETHFKNAHNFADPLVQEVVELWRSRQDMVRAQQRLTLQVKSICRRFARRAMPDATPTQNRAAAEKLYTALTKGDDTHPQYEDAHASTIGLFLARAPLEDQRLAYEKHLTKLGAQLPIAHMCDGIPGFGHIALAKVVGECGDLSAYKSVSAVWKRAGLAVINGERQRRVSGDAALLHGYSPERRAVFWNIGNSLVRSGSGDTPSAYRLIYDERKAYEAAKPEVETAGHAHNRAMRYMTKVLLKNLTLEWRRVGKAIAAE